MTSDYQRGLEAVEAIQRLALTASISSCTCDTKSPDIQWHAPGCRYVYLQYILEQAETATAAIRALASKDAPDAEIFLS